MADINQVITLGIGTPSSIPYFLTFGLGNFGSTPVVDTSRIYGGDPVRYATQEIESYGSISPVRYNSQHITSYSDGDIRRYGSPEIRRFG